MMLIVGAIVRLTSKGPILFRQERVGLYRRTFTIYKFRTMFHDLAERGPCVTKAGDARFTPVGRVLRKYKLDEFPQLYNVFRGDMSLVGPRPKLPQHEHLAMHYRPGITGAATLAFADEEHILKNIPDENLEEFHMHVVSSTKRLLDLEYQEKATFLSDFRLLMDTLLKRRECLDPYTFENWKAFISRWVTK
jgi:lipopolysaccharide/colanic/teichoic acid biosynthesis glycosyltransferase